MFDCLDTVVRLMRKTATKNGHEKRPRKTATKNGLSTTVHVIKKLYQTKRSELPKDLVTNEKRLSHLSVAEVIFFEALSTTRSWIRKNSDHTQDSDDTLRESSEALRHPRRKPPTALHANGFGPQSFPDDSRTNSDLRRACGKLLGHCCWFPPKFSGLPQRAGVLSRIPISNFLSR